MTDRLKLAWRLAVVAYHCFRAAFWLRIYARQLRRRERTELYAFADQGERILGPNAISDDLRARADAL